MKARGTAKLEDAAEETAESVPGTPSPGTPEPDALEASGAPKPEAPAEDKARPTPKISPTMRRIRDDEEHSLKVWLDTIGTQGAFKVQLRRTEPESVRDPRTNANVKTKGYLGTFDHTIDESYIAREFGGGSFTLRVTRPNPTTGSFQYEQGLHRTIEIAGEPRLDRLPSNTPPVAPTTGENNSVVQHALDMMERMVSKQGAEGRGMDPAMGLLIEQMRRQLETSDKERADLRREIGVMRNEKPPADPFKDELLKSMMTGQSGHVMALQARYEAEIRQIKEGIEQDRKRLEDRHDRAMSELRQSHELTISHLRQTNELTIANLKASYEREIAALTTTNLVTSKANETTSSVQAATLHAEIKRLDLEITTLRGENAELRQRKDRSVIEQIKDMKVLKEALGDGEGEGATTTDKVIAALPGAIETIGGLINNRKAAGGGQTVQVQATAAPVQARVVTRPDGQRFIQKGDKLVPAKLKPKTATTDAGTQIELPEIAQPQLALVISMLEAAFGRDEDPTIVAQTGKANIPPTVLAWIRQHHTDQASGVDLFMAKVAKLPGTSPLASQAGRIWLRKVGVALIGE